MLTSPYTPMLFMGEEWGARTPWQFFTDHDDPELAAAITRGRRREFAEHGWKAEDIPDPQDPATRLRSCLDWSERAREPHAELLAWYRRLIALRHAEPELTDPALDAVHVSVGGHTLRLDRGRFRIAVNFSPEEALVPLHHPGRAEPHGLRAGRRLAPLPAAHRHRLPPPARPLGRGAP